MTNQVNFEDSVISPPGETIRSILIERKLDASFVAEELRISTEFFEKIVSGIEAIDDDIATGLSNIFNNSKEFWLNREMLYRAALSNFEEKERVWIEQVPYDDMVKLGWVDRAKNKEQRLERILDFFGVQNIDEWDRKYANIRSDYAFRTSLAYESNPIGVSTWLCKAEKEANKIVCSKWNKRSFQESIDEIRRLSNLKDPAVFIPRLTKICAANGVALVIIPTVKGCRASGASSISGDRATIVMSARYLTEDHFWFTFFHEAGHLIIHNLDKLNIDFSGSPLDSENPKMEEEANEFSQRVLIPQNYEGVLYSTPHTWRDVSRTAAKLGISPGIVVGQMQYRGIIARNWLNFLKRRYRWEGNNLRLVIKNKI